MSQNHLAQVLLDWYKINGRALPWRHKGGAHLNPYVVLVSEIMLQQTTVKTVLSYFERFMARFPTVYDLANASIDEVYLYWQGLGYYSRARSLHAAAKTIVQDFGGKFPKNIVDAKKLKGLGPYTLASYLALAFNLPETVVDGNVIRIICRLYGFLDPVDRIMPKIREAAEKITDKENAADYASAIMDLGAMICVPKNPQCLICPWQEFCQSIGREDIANIPLRSKVAKKEIDANVYLVFNSSGEVLIRKRVEKGLLSGLYEFLWCEGQPYLNAVCANLVVTHIFTHIRLNLHIYTLQSDCALSDGFFVSTEKLSCYAFSTLMRKVWQKYLTL